MHRLDERIAQYDRHIAQIAREDAARAPGLMQLPGVGEHDRQALVAMIGNAHEFKNGRQLAAWLGLVPGQYSSGGKTRLGRITKAGDGYLRSLLVLGAGRCWPRPGPRPTALSRWAMALRGAPRLLEGGRRHRGEERPHGLGGADQGRELQAARA